MFGFIPSVIIQQTLLAAGGFSENKMLFLDLDCLPFLLFTITGIYNAEQLICAICSVISTWSFKDDSYCLYSMIIPYHKVESKENMNLVWRRC